MTFPLVASRNVRLDRNAMQDSGANSIDADTPAPDGSAPDKAVYWQGRYRARCDHPGKL